jgi:Domain of unknown function (DUF4340)
MNLRKTALLAIVVALVALFVFKYELPKDETKRQKESAIAGVTARELKSVTINKEGAPSFTLANRSPQKLKQGDVDDYKSWELRDGDLVIDTALDTGAVSSVMSAIESLKLSDSIPAEEREKDRTVYGLASPAMRLALHGSFGKRTLLLGKRSEYTQQRYLGLEGSDDVYVIQDYIFDQSNRARDDFRSKQRIDVPSWIIKKIVLENLHGKVVLTQPSSNIWKIEEPLTVDADDSAVAELLRRLSSLKVSSFVDDTATDLQKFGLSSPDAKVTITTSEGGSEKANVLRLGVTKGENPTMKLAVGESRPFFEVEGNTISHYLITARELRLKKIFRFDAYDVGAFDITQNQKKVVAATLSKKTPDATVEEWTVNEKSGDEPFIAEYLRTLSQMSGVDFPEPNESLEIENPTYLFTVSVRDKSNPSKSVQRLFKVGPEVKRNGAKRWLIIEGNNGVYIDEESYKSLAPKIETLFKTNPTPIPSAVPTPSSK